MKRLLFLWCISTVLLIVLLGGLIGILALDVSQQDRNIWTVLILIAAPFLAVFGLIIFAVTFVIALISRKLAALWQRDDRIMVLICTIIAFLFSCLASLLFL